MACQFNDPHGQHNQKNPQHSSCDCCYYLASKGIWAFQLPDEYTCIKNAC